MYWNYSQAEAGCSMGAYAVAIVRVIEAARDDLTEDEAIFFARSYNAGAASGLTAIPTFLTER